MDSNYARLDVKDGNFGFKNPLGLGSLDQEKHGYLHPNTGGDLDVDDVLDFEDLPLIFGERKSESDIYGAVFNLTTSIIGAGIMALPATMKVLGLVLGVILIVLMGILSEISVEMLVRFSVQCKASSYGEVVQAALGSIRHIGVFDQWLGHGVWDHRKLVILIVLVLFLAPICALDKIDSLSMTSAASVALAVLFVIVAFVIAFIKLVKGKIEPPRMLPDFGSKKAILDLLVVIPIMSNAYVCHFNVQPIYNELEGRAPHKMYRVGRITTVICVLVYASTAISGYLLFGKDTESDVLTNFDKDLGIRFSTALNYIVRIGYVFHLILVFPVIHFSLRQTVDTLLFEGLNPLCESRQRCLVLTVVILAFIYLGSTMIPNILTAFKFTGAATAVSLGFTFPALIALRLGKEGNELSHKEVVLSWFMLTLATIVSIAGVIGNIYGLKSESE
ncbi:amino acid transporter AVT6E-like isoform X2 [Primulina huaijiensis]|uniref:amino acid transporter AVT6E-like isoform X2 n=1 Tax=Primulina huaijiensis TaxID=1492673 RepID=UPI003CC78708